MFGLSLPCQLIQGPAIRTWNRVAHFANLLWYKLNYTANPIMPRSRRRHHSRSRTRSRSRSPSCERDREIKRRKIENYDSPQHRSDSPEDDHPIDNPKDQNVSTTSSPEQESKTDCKTSSANSKQNEMGNTQNVEEDHQLQVVDQDQLVECVQRSPPSLEPVSKSDQDYEIVSSNSITPPAIVLKPSQNALSPKPIQNEVEKTPAIVVDQDQSIIEPVHEITSSPEQISEMDKGHKKSLNLTGTPSKVSKTSQKPRTPKQFQKEMERAQKLKEREMIKEEKLRALEEKKKLKQEENEKRIKEKQEKLEQKQKEIEERQKNRDLKEEKRKIEREEKELKRKEKEEEKRREQNEKNKEKQKIEEKKQKAATAFVSFFTKKNDSTHNDERKVEKLSTSSTFMPFEVKSDMRVAPICRVILNTNQKNYIMEALTAQLEHTYLDELKSGRKPLKSTKTWPFTETDRQDCDVVVVEEVAPGESIEEQPKPPEKQRAKFLKFTDNRRPAYFGTWRKTSSLIKPRRPFAIDIAHFDYDVDSDEEWEEEDSGESLHGSDDDKENESGNEYEEDNEFFVPHGHLSDDEMNDDENDVVSPEAHKAKLKLLKKEFEEEMRSKTERIKPRVIGCIWYNKDGSNVDAAIDEYLRPLSIISNGPIIIKKRSKFITNTPMKRSFLPGKELSAKFLPGFLKWIHGSSKNSKALVEDFLNCLQKQDINVEVSKTSLMKQLKKLAVWTRCPEGGPVLKKHCWFVHKNVSEEYNVNLSIPN